MTNDTKNPTQGRNSEQESKGGATGPTRETEAAVKGGAEPAKRQAERDWENSSKEEGE